jgi:nucleotide-binding universal stress UspA family protein
MTFKNIVVFADATPASVNRLRLAASLAHRYEAHLIGVYVVPGNLDHYPSDAFVRGTEAIRTLRVRYRAAAERAVLDVGRQFADFVSHDNIQAEFRVVWNAETNNILIHNSLYADLVIIGQFDPNASPQNRLPEHLLLASGVPILVVPDAWTSDTIGEHIVIAWNASKEARRAVTDALPLVSSARTVKILIVDPEKYSDRHGEEPGATIATHLARHGAKVEVERFGSAGAATAETILKFAAQAKADLLVSGAYSHSLSRQMLFGSVTRAILKDTTLPTLMSH